MKRAMMAAIAAAMLVGCVRQERPVRNSDEYIDTGHTVIHTGIPDVRMYQTVNMENRTVCTTVVYRDDGPRGGVAIDCLPYYHEGSTPSGMQVDGE